LIIASQIRINGKRRAGQRNDEVTLKPAMGRAFELASISGDESVNVLRFLMSVPQPGPEVVDAIQSGVAWFEAAKISGHALGPSESTERWSLVLIGACLQIHARHLVGQVL